jgi:solute carrier family 8 (sodium/calcium exchanger)
MVSTTSAPGVLPRICEVGGATIGNVLPLGGDSENQWWADHDLNPLRLVLCMISLAWCFAGVAIAADIFMAAIEAVTDAKRRIKDPVTGRYQQTRIWNDTVANLTLMALGSSAPEILLNVIEILSGRFFSGALGPSTIVGSAAFNLFCISAVCVASIPDGENRKIEGLGVYAITAFFSVFAYVWLIIILVFSSENIVTVLEGTITFLLFPVLVVLAFIADKGYCSSHGGSKRPSDLESMTPEELGAVEAKIRKQHGDSLTEDQMIKAIKDDVQSKLSRAAYRLNATRALLGKRSGDIERKISKDDPLCNVVPAVGAGPDPKELLTCRDLLPTCAFKATSYTVLESAGHVCLPVIRTGTTSAETRVAYSTREGTAKKGQDFVDSSGVLVFSPGETEQTIDIKIIDDTAFEENEDFYIGLTEEKGFATNVGPSCRVVIIDDDMPGVLGFESDQFKVTETTEDVQIQLRVERTNGGSGTIGCTYRTVDETAVQEADYEAAHGQLTFDAGQMSATIDISIKACGRYERTETFRVELSDATGGAKLGGEAKDPICTVFIEADMKRKERLDRMMSGIQINYDKSRVGHSNWINQFRDALRIWPDDAEEGDCQPPSVLDKTIHLITMPWKLLFAFVPPTDYCGGWICFCTSLIAIGVTTAVIGDVAMLLGCTMGCPDEITAITFVALGTSVPDLFASKTAAVNDPEADASIGNVTGSNSVNVFLGLGLPWGMASIYWHFEGPNAEWIDKYGGGRYAWLSDVEKKNKAAFVVEAGGLADSVIMFSSCAFACMGCLYLRRIFCDGELGGPKMVKWATAVFFVFLWCVYIGYSSFIILETQP